MTTSYPANTTTYTLFPVTTPVTLTNTVTIATCPHSGTYCPTESMAPATTTSVVVSVITAYVASTSPGFPGYTAAGITIPARPTTASPVMSTAVVYSPVSASGLAMFTGAAAKPTNNAFAAAGAGLGAIAAFAAFL